MRPCQNITSCTDALSGTPAEACHMCYQTRHLLACPCLCTAGNVHAAFHLPMLMPASTTGAHAKQRMLKERTRGSGAGAGGGREGRGYDRGGVGYLQSTWVGRQHNRRAPQPQSCWPPSKPAPQESDDWRFLQSQRHFAASPKQAVFLQWRDQTCSSNTKVACVSFGIKRKVTAVGI